MMLLFCVMLYISYMILQNDSYVKSRDVIETITCIRHLNWT